MSGRVLVDTGPIVAIFNERDEFHEICVETLQALRPPLLTCWPVITEAAWLLRTSISDIQAMLRACRGELFQFVDLSADDMDEVARILDQYGNLELQLADACLLHLAQREGIRTLFTLDRRDFEVMRLKGNRRLKLIPDL